MNFLVTGGAGFIGSHLVETLLSKQNHVTVIDNFNDYYDPQIKRSNIRAFENSPNFQLVEGEILDYDLLDQLFSQNNFDVIVHLAARAGVRPSIQEPFLYEQVNVQGTMNILEVCKNHSVKKLVFASSSSVYGANKKVPFAETDFVDNPISPYAATKKSGELICYTYHRLYDISVNCLRFFTVYGPRQRPEMAIHKFAKAIDKGEPIPMFGSGTSKRDYTFIEDIIHGIEGAIENCDGYNVFNLGESNTVELKYLISLIENALGKKAQINQLPDQPGDVPITFADVSKAKKMLNYNPQVPIEEGIIKFIDWFKKQN